MPSFKAVFLALAAFSASALATPVDNNDIFANNLAKRRVNHADEYGYPHNRGPHVSDGRKMSPGGWIDPNPNNIGTTCRFHASCHYNKPLALGFCNDNGKCDFKCLGDSVRQNGWCVGAYKAPTCARTSQCPRTTIAHASSVCISGKCTFECATGYNTRGNSCVAQKDVCNGVARPTVQNGFALCQRGRWVPKCNSYLGLTLYKRGNAYYCVNTLTDPNNCGSVGNVCPAGYNGLGTPVCRNGECNLNCSGYTRRRHNGSVYCSAI